MYVRGYLQGSENGRVVTIGTWITLNRNIILSLDKTDVLLITLYKKVIHTSLQIK